MPGSLSSLCIYIRECLSLSRMSGLLTSQTLGSLCNLPFSSLHLHRRVLVLGMNMKRSGWHLRVHHSKPPTINKNNPKYSISYKYNKWVNTNKQLEASLDFGGYMWGGLLQAPTVRCRFEWLYKWQR